VVGVAAVSAVPTAMFPVVAMIRMALMFAMGAMYGRLAPASVVKVIAGVIHSFHVHCMSFMGGLLSVHRVANTIALVLTALMSRRAQPADAAASA